MDKLRMTVMAGATMLVAASGAGAQMRGPASVPAGFIPPAGLCRVWFDGVAPGRQPAPTDCATARANLRGGSHLVYGPSLRTGTNDGRWNDGRRGDDGRYGQYGQLSDKQRHELEKERRKAEHEREKARRKAGKHHGRGHDDGDDDDDRDERRDDRRGRVDNGGIFGGTTTNGGTTDTRKGGVWTRAGTPQGNICIDANRDGICDNTGRRVP